MKILSVGIKNFRNIGSIRLDTEGIVGLVSLNNYGKSNFFKALRFAMKFLRSSIGTRSRMMRSVSYIPLTPDLAGRDFEFEIEFVDEKLGDHRYVKYGFSFAWANDKNTGAIIRKSFLQTKAVCNGRYSFFFQQDGTDAKYRSKKEDGRYSNLKLENGMLATDVLVTHEKFLLKDVILAIKKVRYSLCDDLDVSISFRPPPFQRKEYDDLVDLVRDDAPQCLYKLKTEHAEKYDEFCHIVGELFPEFDSIDVSRSEISFGQENQLNKIPEEVPFTLKKELFTIFVKNRFFNQPVDINIMSKGTYRVAWLLLVALWSSRDGGSLLAIDEIETSIHPRLIKKLLRALYEIIGHDNSLLISTHSPILTHYLDLQSVYVGVPDESGVASFKRFRKSKIDLFMKKALQLHETAGDYLFDLLSGGADELTMLKSYLEE